MRHSTGRTGDDTDWDLEWDRAWKAHPANPWFKYQADAYAGWVEAGPGAASPARPMRVLKTDAFEEACGFRHLRRLFDGRTGVLMDVSPRILARALHSTSDDPAHPIACVTDVRRLGLKPAVFDLILSPSTLDHFSDERDFATSLGELYGALRPGGHLLITLDNPANPILRVRQLVHALVGPVGGVVPFPMGRTLSRAALVAALARAGFEVMDSGYLVHAPRIVGLWLGEWAARHGSHAWAGRLRRWFVRWDRTLARVGGLSAHFVVVRCRRPVPG